MRVLVTEGRFGDADPLITRLRAGGCEVSVCHYRAGICQALAPGGRCPLDHPGGVALTVDVRGPGADLTAREFGVICALRERVPVAVVPAGPGGETEAPAGLEGRVTVTTADEVVDACTSALRTAASRAGTPSE
ncbi:hypothetical protein [Amycolatopsis suaedae]|uniref:Uncharacterized protein n=1 Tax=Amycolatopsis suaedae TaxID=2510978 RepID=A0A4Q7JG04_9PSEU|nr:hypothetical protein [Amycolatopsis suaedae]RZQ65903.1 hypothetical protein EWH70_02180 [Amycolatopsis suaedae]